MKRSGVTCIEFLLAIFVIWVAMVTWKFVAGRFGTWYGIAAALLAGSLTVVLFYACVHLLYKRALQKARDKYRDIYRVIAAPTAPRIIAMAKGAEIKVGDYGWEAGPSRNDGLIYLQGLTPNWTVVWHAGLHPDEVERVGAKPYSQYDSWHPVWAKPPSLPPCPFTVIERKTRTLGRPHHSHRYFD